MQGYSVQNKKFIEIGVPKDYTGAACATEYINMGKANKITFLIHTGAWAAGTAAVTIGQATSDGGSVASVSFTRYYTVAGDTVTAATAASNTFNLSAANTLYIVEVDSTMLTESSNYDWVALAIASPGVNADFYSVVAIADNLRYGTEVSVLT